MFTGIVESVGSIKNCVRRGGDMRLTVDVGGLDLADVKLGDSISVNGVCLTAVELDGNTFHADVSAETLAHTTLKNINVGQKVNLEKALTPSSRLGGHLVSGHVDGVGTVVERKPDGQSERFRVNAPPELAHYIARKGSICIDGISLTVNSVDGSVFDVNIVPHTLENTTMATYGAGVEVNLEVDIIARYLERMLKASSSLGDGTLTVDTLRRNGFTD